MTPSRPEGSVRNWLAFAEGDLMAAKLLLGQPGVPSAYAAFHCQQCVEKAVKAVLVHANTAFPFVHDLEELLEICRVGGIKEPPDAGRLNILTPFAAQNRYEPMGGQPEDEEIRRFIGWAESTLKWAKAMTK